MTCLSRKSKWDKNLLRSTRKDPWCLTDASKATKPHQPSAFWGLQKNCFAYVFFFFLISWTFKQVGFLSLSTNLITPLSQRRVDKLLQSFQAPNIKIKPHFQTKCLRTRVLSLKACKSSKLRPSLYQQIKTVLSSFPNVCSPKSFRPQESIHDSMGGGMYFWWW